MRYVVRVLVVSAAGTTHRSFSVDLGVVRRPLIVEYLHRQPGDAPDPDGVEEPEEPAADVRTRITG